MDKPVKAKPHFYSQCFKHLQEIAKDLGYNLVLHGSLNRDLDLIAIPWVDHPSSHIDLLKEFCIYLGVNYYEDKDQYLYSILPGNRSSYVINLNRINKFTKYIDEQWYLDISITPL